MLGAESEMGCFFFRLVWGSGFNYACPIIFAQAAVYFQAFPGQEGKEEERLRAERQHSHHRVQALDVSG
jgi:hypothetical protein